jgi:hypothetical protein
VPVLTVPTGRVLLDLGDTVGVLSCERIEYAGTRAFGYLYDHVTIRRWMAGPGYRFGHGGPPYPGDDWWARWFWAGGTRRRGVSGDRARHG